ncbi:hypothetical protein [Bradyrhizobium liaoningense]|uniref:hypothetical protein n=1 Tax=Bradyrhizobium liaoningense TaxID=43992 RepID=UPI0004B03894|nr:hypothetical protein [Bradyrhizobium liaoningense]
MDIITKLDELHRTGKMHGFSIWPTSGGYQASLAVQANSFRIRVGETPSDAVAQVLEDGPLELSDERVELLAPPAVDEPPLDPDQIEVALAEIDEQDAAMWDDMKAEAREERGIFD